MEFLPIDLSAKESNYAPARSRGGSYNMISFAEMGRVSGCIAILLGVSACTQTMKPASSSLPPPVSKYVLTPADIQVVTEGVTKSLKDPNSAMFGGMAAALRSDGMITVCGYVNAKNSFGGYVGMTPFFGLMTKTPVHYFGVTGMGGTETKTTVILQMCSQEGAPI